MELIAHRGNNGLFFENSKAAILTSLNTDYIAGVEFDVRYTLDKKFVIIHDNFLGRVSDYNGLVSTSTLKKLKEINFGSKNYQFKIATLDEVLKEIKGNKKIIIELKYDEASNEFLNNLLDVLNKYPKLNLYVCSFNYNLIKKLKKLANFKVGLIIGYTINITHQDEDFDFFLVNYYNRPYFKSAKETFIWTINDKKTLLNLLKEKRYDKFISDVSYLF